MVHGNFHRLDSMDRSTELCNGMDGKFPCNDIGYYVI